MRKIVAGLFISLDGVTESPEKWTPKWFDAEAGADIGANMAESDTMLLGRRTYQEWAGYWPGKTSADDPFAEYINTVPKLVASTTLTSVDWKFSALLGRDLVAELSRLKAQPGKNIVISGSVTLIRSLLKQGLLVELRLQVYPVVVGSGARLFEGGMDQIPMKLASSKAFSSGVLSLVYEPEREAAQPEPVEMAAGTRT